MLNKLAIIFGVFATVTLLSAPASAKVTHFSEDGFQQGPQGPFALLYGDAVEAGSGDVYVANEAFNFGSTTGAVYKFTEGGAYANVTLETAGTPAGSIGFLSSSTFATGGIAFDGSGGEFVYVADIAHRVVDRFDHNGKYLCQITGAATPSASECNGAKGSATPNGGIEPTGIAVDGAGDIYVADRQHNAIDKFGSAGQYIEQIVNPAVVSPASIALDKAGDLYIVNGAGLAGPGSNVVKDSAGTFTVVNSNSPSAVGVDVSTGHVYVYDQHEDEYLIDEYDASGSHVSTFGVSGAQYLGFLSVGGTSGKVYETHSCLGCTGEVHVFGPDAVVPTVTVAPPTSVEASTATLHGEADPDTAHGGGAVTECSFEYVTAKQFEENPANHYEGATTVPCSPATPYASATSVSAAVSGLAPSITYHFRLAAANANNHQSYSEAPEEETFTTKGPPTITEVAPAAIKRTSAAVTAKIDPKGYDTTYQIEYGETAKYGAITPPSPADVGSGEVAVPVSQEIANLKVGTTYFYRLLATNSHGTEAVSGKLTTLPVAGVEYQAALAGPHTATIKASVDPFGSIDRLGDATSCEVRYVSEAEYGASGYAGAGVGTAPCMPASVAAESDGENVIVQLSGLTSDTVYRYRFVVANESGEVAAAEHSLATFGVEAFTAELSSEKGGSEAQAGGHPYELTTTIGLRAVTNALGYEEPSGRIRDVSVQLPPGLIGDPAATAKCTRYDDVRDMCSAGAQVGVLDVTLAKEKGGPPTVSEEPLFDLVPPKGVATELGTSLISGQAVAFIDAKVRTGSDYGITTDSLNIATIGEVRGVSVTIWGVPADPSHNAERVCLGKKAGEGGVPIGQYVHPCASNEPPKPFLRDPTACTGALVAKLEVDSYNAPGDFVKEEKPLSAGMMGCEKLRFSPALEVMPESNNADSPTGLGVHLHIPQQESATGLAQADLKGATVTLPRGVTVNPAGAGGLAGCPLEGSEGINLHNAEPASCPDASKIGEVELETPLFPQRVFKGGVYVAQQGNAGAAQGANPFGSLVAIYIGIDEPETGVVVKLAGDVAIDPTTGQITTTFAENPQLPFEELRLKFFGGPRSALATPRACGSYETTSLLEPWSHQGAPGETGTPDATPFSSFTISSGPAGTACAAPGFAPPFSAGTSSNDAGAFSPFVLNLTRKDGEQRLSTVALTMPAGLSGEVSAVTLCQEPQASVGDCPAASKIGHVNVRAGVGSDPIELPEPGKPQDAVYLTGPYEGAPFGLSVVVPAEAGPFNLDEGARPVVVRAKVEVDPHTAEVTVVSDPMPKVLQGVPLDVRSIEVAVDRPGFIFNPTSCDPMAVAGAIGSGEGANEAVSSRFQAADCSNLAFHPSFTVSTEGTTSKADGASLDVVVRTTAGSANIKEVHVSLPKQLPSRLDTLKLACRDEVFEANPAACPAASAVGMASAVTPILAHPLVGPAYLVSHGGAEFPDLEIVLQAEGVTLVLDGKTNIKNAITTSTFNTVPDAPVSSFELKLPEGPHSVLGAPGGKLCAASLAMPTIMRGQNGALVEQKTKVAVTGCKPAVVVLRHSVKGMTATITASVPSAGVLVATAPGLSRAVRRPARAGSVTMKLRLTSVEREFLAKHPGRRLREPVKLLFAPKHGGKLAAGVTVLIG